MHRVCTGQDYMWRMDGKLSKTPIWTQNFYEWYAENRNLIKQVHTDKHYETMETMITLEFHSPDEATMFALRFA